MNQIGNTIRLLRIPFSLLLMPLFLFAVSQAEKVDVLKMTIAFLIIHFLVYPASNGYNSYVDRDEGSIGGLEKPPLPTEQLFQLTLIMDFISLVLSYIFISPVFSIAILFYILASRAYSSRQIRLKKYPVIGFLTVVVFQGAYTYWMALLGITGEMLPFNKSNIFVLLACSFQIAGAYPLTQVYQHQQDLADGVKTLSYQLGYRGTFAFTMLMFVFSNLFYFLYFQSIGSLNHFMVLALFFIPIICYFMYWFLRVWKDESEANFKNTMRMNLAAAVCMNACFSYLIFIKYFL